MKIRTNYLFISIALSLTVLLIGAAIILVSYFYSVQKNYTLNIQGESYDLLSRLQSCDSYIQDKLYSAYLRANTNLNDKAEAYQLCRNMASVSPYVDYAYIEYRPDFFPDTHLFCPCYDVWKNEVCNIADPSNGNFNYTVKDELYIRAMDTDGAEFHAVGNINPFTRKHCTTFSFFVKDSRNGRINALISILLNEKYEKDVCNSMKGWQPSDNIVMFFLDSGDIIHYTFSDKHEVNNVYNLIRKKFSGDNIFMSKIMSVFSAPNDTVSIFYHDDRYVYSAISDKYLNIGMISRTEYKPALVRNGILSVIMGTFAVSIILVLIITYLMMRRMLRSRTLEINRQKELQSAFSIQKAMLPHAVQSIPQINISACLIPAKNVGGDLYYYFCRSDFLYFCIGDVSGKGMPASLFMSKTISLFTCISRYAFMASDIAEQLNFELTQNNDNSMFVTMFIGVLNLNTGELQYCNAGHEEPIFWSGLDTDKPIYLHTSDNIPLGVEEDMTFTQSTINLKAGCQLLLYTDGVTEAKRKTSEMYGEARLLHYFSTHCMESGQDMCDLVVADIKEFVAGNKQSDDITMLSLTIKHIDSTIILTNDVSELKKLPKFLDSIAKVLIFSDEEFIKLRVAIDEVMTNCIRYAYPDQKGKEVSLHVYTANGELVFTVTDHGIPFNPLTYETSSIDDILDMDIDDVKIGGLGIPLMKKTFDNLYYKRESDKNILKLVKKLNTLSNEN